MKVCVRCKQTLGREKFYKNKRLKDGLASECKTCSKERMGLWVLKNSQQWRNRCKKYHKQYRDNHSVECKLYNKKTRLKYPDRVKCRSSILTAIRSGKIKKRNSCEICYNGPTHGHHEDYSKPLDVIWLCSRCHAMLHASVLIS